MIHLRPIHTAALHEKAGGALKSARSSTGFPSPAEDATITRIDLVRALVRHPEATFYFQVRGHSMRGVGVMDGSILMVDRAITPAHGQIVVAVIDGDLTCRKLHLKDGRMKLQATDPHVPDMEPAQGDTFEIWGVAITSIQQHLA